MFRCKLIAQLGAVMALFLPLGMGAADLPTPALLHSAPPLMHAKNHQPLRLSLADAVSLALRNNTQVKDVRLSQVLDRFSWRVLRQRYAPQWGDLTANTNGSIGESGIRIKTPLGSTFSDSMGEDVTSGGLSQTLKFSQPLLKGFLLNRMKNQDSAMSLWERRLTYRDDIAGTIAQVITQYRYLVQQSKSLVTQQANLHQVRQQLQNLKIHVAAGDRPRSDIIQQQSSLAAAKLSIINAKQSIVQAKQQFLRSLGLDTSARVHIDTAIAIPNHRIPNKAQAEKDALRHNSAYRNALFMYISDKRTYIEDKNDTRWDLSLDGSDEMSGPHLRNNNVSAGLSLDIPLHNLNNDQSKLNDKVAIKKAKLALIDAKKNTLSTVDNDIEQIRLQIQNVHQAQDAIRFAKQNFSNNMLKYKYGLSSQYVVDQVRQQLLTKQIGLISAEIAYLNQLTKFRQYVGTLLPQWHIDLKGVLGLESEDKYD